MLTVPFGSTQIDSIPVEAKVVRHIVEYGGRVV